MSLVFSSFLAAVCLRMLRERRENPTWREDYENDRYADLHHPPARHGIVITGAVMFSGMTIFSLVLLVKRLLQ